VRERCKCWLKDSGCEKEACAPPTGFNGVGTKLYRNSLIPVRRVSSNSGSVHTGMATAKDVASKAQTKLTRHKHPNAALNLQPGARGLSGRGGRSSSAGEFGIVRDTLFAEDGHSLLEGSGLFNEYSLIWCSEVPMAGR
jgi:hypothetical protein